MTAQQGGGTFFGCRETVRIRKGNGHEQYPAGQEGQLFRLVLAVKVEIICLTFLLLHFGQDALVVLCSEILEIKENFFLQSWHSYS